MKGVSRSQIRVSLSSFLFDTMYNSHQKFQKRRGKSEKRQIPWRMTMPKVMLNQGQRRREHPSKNGNPRRKLMTTKATRTWSLILKSEALTLLSYVDKQVSVVNNGKNTCLKLYREGGDRNKGFSAKPREIPHRLRHTENDSENTRFPSSRSNYIT